MTNVVLVAAKRTPVGSFRSTLASLPAPSLAATAIKSLFSSTNAPVPASSLDEVFLGNVLSANLGQAPATQAARLAGLEATVPCTSVNKVCASGLKAVMFAAQSIQLGQSAVTVAGGMESMSNAPFYLPPSARSGLGYGHKEVLDSIIKDGLWDAQYQIHMGQCAEETAKRFRLARQQQDEHAIESYKRAAKAHELGWFKPEIAPVEVKVKGKVVQVTEDEEWRKVNFDKIPALKPVFDKNGTVTAANASTLNDGASAVLLMSEERAKELGVKPLARILSYGDSNRDPKEFTIAPTDVIQLILKRAGKSLQDVALFEINEAFSVVVRANEQLLDLDPQKVNIAGGAVALGHPIGSSGCRILVTLTHLLKPGQIGVAAICNGGGGASGMVIERL